MGEIKKGVETPKTEDENVESLQELESKLTAKKVMEQNIEDCSQFTDNHNIDIKDITDYFENYSKITEIIHSFPDSTLHWAVQRERICNRVNATDFIEWYNLKKELTFQDYCDLEEALNKDTDGITMNELMIITGEDEETLLHILEGQCQFIVVNHSPVEFVMDIDLNVRLIPIVDDNNKLTGAFRMQYLFTSQALSCFAENYEYYKFFIA